MNLCYIPLGWLWLLVSVHLVSLCKDSQQTAAEIGPCGHDTRSLPSPQLACAVGCEGRRVGSGALCDGFARPVIKGFVQSNQLGETLVEFVEQSPLETTSLGCALQNPGRCRVFCDLDWSLSGQQVPPDSSSHLGAWVPSSPTLDPSEV